MSSDLSDSGYGFVNISQAGLAQGDTKSIVLALQGLQEKIRRLEDDRNYHRNQCQEAHAAHEAYKREVEAQLDRERAEHRVREDDLQALLRKAMTEKRLLQDTTESSRTDLAAFREQLDTLVDTERASGKQREEVMRAELETYRAEIVELRAFHEKLSQTITQLKAERELILATNKRLEVTVADLINMNGKILGDANRGKARQGNIGAQHSRPRCSSMNCRRNCADTSTILASQRIAASYHNDPAFVNMSTMSGGSQQRAASTYRDPTVASMARAVEQHQSRQPSPARWPSPVPVTRPVSAKRRAASASPVAKESDALTVVYNEMENEYQRLVDAYKFKVQEENPNQNEINDLVGAIDQKADQLRLMRLARVGVSEAGDNDSRRGTPRRSPRGTKKAVQRGALVNQLRNMLMV